MRLTNLVVNMQNGEAPFQPNDKTNKWKTCHQPSVEIRVHCTGIIPSKIVAGDVLCLGQHLQWCGWVGGYGWIWVCHPWVGKDMEGWFESAHNFVLDGGNPKLVDKSLNKWVDVVYSIAYNVWWVLLIRNFTHQLCQRVTGCSPSKCLKSSRSQPPQSWLRWEDVPWFWCAICPLYPHLCHCGSGLSRENYTEGSQFFSRGWMEFVEHHFCDWISWERMSGVFVQVPVGKAPTFV